MTDEDEDRPVAVDLEAERQQMLAAMQRGELEVTVEPPLYTLPIRLRENA